MTGRPGRATACPVFASTYPSRGTVGRNRARVPRTGSGAAGTPVVVVTHALGWYVWWVGMIAAAVCIVLRGLAIVLRWQAPRPGRSD